MIIMMSISLLTSETPVGHCYLSEDGYIDAQTLGPGDSSAFEVRSFDQSLPDKASTIRPDSQRRQSGCRCASGRR